MNIKWKDWFTIPNILVYIRICCILVWNNGSVGQISEGHCEYNGKNTDYTRNDFGYAFNKNKYL